MTSYFHLNCRGLSSNWDSFYSLLCELQSDKFNFDVIGISEIFTTTDDMCLKLPGYHDWLSRCHDDGPRGGIGLFIRDSKDYKIREDLNVFILHIFESLFVEIIKKSSRNLIVGVVYRSDTEPHADLDIFQCPDKAHNEFMNLYIDAFNTSFPIIEIPCKTAYLKREPWCTSGLIELSKTKAKLLSKKLTLPSEHNINKYKEVNILHKRL